ncbi:bifunctional lysylphosphatidylglycerol flippase/synthetase MprF [Actinocorallia longicatena]|uniref:Phosphatidylglycerol lysyltransferase C-terminal domain-containing protein n=1 Tax=Actinocorallia longicatena TaxID=111803 RepID=A0ABP6PYA6_9ACTN
MDRPRNSLAAPVAGVAILIAVPVVDAPGWLHRLSFVATGRPLAPEHALLLGLAVLIAARGLMLGRRAAAYGLLLVVGLGVLAAVAGEDPLWRLPLLLVAALALLRTLESLPVRPHPSRVRAALRTVATVVLVAAAACLLFARVSVTSLPHDAVAGLGGSLDVEGASWLPIALGLLGWIGLIAAVQLLLAPSPAPVPGDESERSRVAELVAEPGSGTLAPFALRQDKTYVFAPGGRAAIGYRVLFGVAVAGGDPVGDPRSHASAMGAFLAMCLRNGWRPAVLAAACDWPGMKQIGIGDEVVLRPPEFTLSGRSMRNVRQAVQRTVNAGVTTEVLPERELSPSLRAELREIARLSLGGAAERGFSMNLDELLTGRHPGCVVAVAHAGGRAVAFQRYASCGSGLSLDAMRRHPDAPNGVHERLIADLVAQARVPEVSLNFAAFRELLDTKDRTAAEQVGYRVLHLLDPLIAVESLYLFNRKFRPSYQPRSVVFRSWSDLAWVAAALLTLEFGRTAPPRAEAVTAPETRLEHP